MNIKRGDIYWITKSPYQPTAGSVQEPGRPGIVVSNDANNTFSSTLEIVYLTCQPKKPLPTHCTISSSEKTSTALCEQVHTICKEQLGDYIGLCTEDEMAQLDRCLAISLGIPDPLEDLRKALREAAVLMPGEETYDPLKETEEMKSIITRQEKALAVANAKVELLQTMYNDLLTRTIA